MQTIMGLRETKTRYMYICMYVYMYIYTYICMYVYIYILYYNHWDISANSRNAVQI